MSSKQTIFNLLTMWRVENIIVKVKININNNTIQGK